MKKSYFISLALLLGLGMLFGADVLAAAGSDPLGLNYGAATGLGDDDIRFTIASIIKIALSLLGMITVVIILWAGFEWMTAGGSEEKISSAKKRLSSAVVGLLIVLSAYSLTNFVVKNLYEATQGSSYQSGEVK